MDREKIALTGTQETMLATLYGRAIDSRSPNPILGDDEADRAVQRIDYDFRKTGVKATAAVGIAVRAKRLDDWTAEFLACHEEATMLHLACGLDTRVHRLNPPPTVRWFDVDYPEVIELRARLLPPRPRDYHTIGASVTDHSWLDAVPADRPTVAVFEGLSMYLHKEDGKQLIERITGRFPHGQLLFDCYGTWGIRLQKLVPAVRNSGATLYWGIDDPYEVESWSNGLECLDVLRAVEMPGLDRMPTAGRLGMQLMARIPGLRDMAWILRYRF